MKKIDDNLYEKVVKEIYPTWKKLNKKTKSIYPRGVNLHESISEYIVCYVNDYFHSTGSGSEDAIDSSRQKIQIKATSNFDRDLTSFGPTSEFEVLEFARLDQEEDKMYLYKIPIEDLYDVYVNANETFADQQARGVRPRFSIITKYLDDENIAPYVIVDMVTGEYSN